MFNFNKVFLKGLVETCIAYTNLISFTWYEDIFHVLTKVVGDVRTLYSVWTKSSYIVLVIYVLSLFSVGIQTHLRMYISNKIVVSEN